VFTSTGSAPIRLEPAATTVGPPTSREHLSGELFVDARGTLYYCYGGTPPHWQRVAGRPAILDAIVTGVATIIGAIRDALRPRP
jgi:hypothetical protein